MELLARHLQASLGISVKEEEKREPVIEEFNLKGIAKYIQLDKCKKIHSFLVITLYIMINNI